MRKTWKNRGNRRHGDETLPAYHNENATIDIYRKQNHQFQREIYVDELEECNVPVTYAETDVDDGILDILRRLPVNTGMYFSSNTPAIWTTMKSQKY